MAVTVSGTPCGRARGGVSRRAIRALAAMIGRTANGRVGFGPGLRPSRLPSVRDWRGRRCRRAAPDILRTQGRPGRQPSAGTPRRQMPKSIGRRAWPQASSPQGGSRFLRDFGHDSGDRSLDLRVRQRALPRLQLDTDRNRFRTFGQALAQVDVEDADVRDERPLSALRSLHNIAGPDAFGDDERQIALDRHEVRTFELGLRFRRLCFRPRARRRA